MEKFHEPVASTRLFIGRLARSITLGLWFIVLALTLGMIGYHVFEGMSWSDAFVNAAMILSGMGPLGTLNSVAGKIFAGLYALFSGLIFIAIMGVIFAPVIHRFFHTMNLDGHDRKNR